MRIALIADIHGNAYALDVALADIQAQGVDRVICLGDAIQGGAQPAETVQRLRDLGCPVVLGNADAWLLTGQATGNEGVTPVQEAVRQWSLAQLSPADQEFIAAFAPTITVPLNDRDTLLCFHGSPASFDDIILPVTSYTTLQQHFQGHTARWFTGGHTHLQQVRRIGDGWFFNPGSVGVAYSHEQQEADFRLDPWAEYAILTATATAISLEFRRVPFAAEPLVAIARRSGRPDAERLAREYRVG
jgi:predicted phosphodiesterase